MTTSQKPTKDDGHSCSYHCDRPECIKAQRDYLREALAQPAADDKAVYDWSLLEATQESLREHMAIANELQQRLAKYEAGGDPVGEVRRVGMASYGRPWHEIYWYDKDVDVPHGTKLYIQPQAELPAERVACNWSLTDDDNMIYESACGEAWVFNDGGPKENNVRFCQGCGKPVNLFGITAKDQS